MTNAPAAWVTWTLMSLSSACFVAWIAWPADAFGVCGIVLTLGAALYEWS